MRRPGYEVKPKDGVGIVGGVRPEQEANMSSLSEAARTLCKPRVEGRQKVKRLV